jgi:CTP:molybdopterin cytidylyltransferase MocA
MGEPKGLLNFSGRPWLLEQLTRFQGAGGEQAVLVLGYHANDYFQKIPGLLDSVQEPIRQWGLELATVINAYPEGGQFTSLCCAFTAPFIKAAPGAFILPIDVPSPGMAVYEILAAALAGPAWVVIPRFQSRGGHPVLLAATFIRQLLRLAAETEGTRLDVEIQKLSPERTVRPEVSDPQVRMNLNLPADFEDYSLLRQGNASGGA